MKIQIRQEEVWASQFQRNKACIGTQRMHRLDAGGATKMITQAGQAGPTKAPLEVLCDRRQLEDAYVATHGTPKPRLEFQGSDGYLKKQWRLIAKGELGYIPAKHIVSALPEEGERPSSTHKKITVDGWDREDEEEVRSHPTSWRQLERLRLTFRTTLLMCTAALPQFGNLKVTKGELAGRTSLAGSLPRATPPCCSQSAMHGARSTRWCTKAPLSPRPSRISGATEKPKKGGKGSCPRGRPGPSRRARAARASPQHPLGSMAGPLGFQESQRGGVLQRSSPPQQVFGIMRPIPQLPGHEGWMGLRCPPIEACATDMPSPSQVTGGHSGCHRPRGFPVSVGTTGRECTQRGRANPRATAEGRQSGGGQDGLRWEGTSPGCHRPRKPRKRSGPSQGTPEGRKHPFPRTHGIRRGGKPHLPMDAGHPRKTEAQTEVDAPAGAGVVKAVPHPAVRWEG